MIVEVPDREKIYISGPMLGKIDNNIEAFNWFEKALSISMYCEVINPTSFRIKSDTGSEVLDREQWLEIDLMVLRKCDAIFMMPGWHKSEGACIEYAEAKKCGLKIYGVDFEENEQ